MKTDETIIQLDRLPPVLTVPEAAKVLRLGRNSLYQAIREGEIPVIRIGRRLLIPRARLEQLLMAEKPSGDQ